MKPLKLREKGGDKTPMRKETARIKALALDLIDELEQSIEEKEQEIAKQKQELEFLKKRLT